STRPLRFSPVAAAGKIFSVDQIFRLTYTIRSHRLNAETRQPTPPTERRDGRPGTRTAELELGHGREARRRRDAGGRPGPGDADREGPQLPPAAAPAVAAARAGHPLSRAGRPGL